MTERYVEIIMDKVTNACNAKGIGEGFFWHWLGNVRFKEDKGELTSGRASFIEHNINSLLNEYLEAGNE